MKGWEIIKLGELIKEHGGVIQTGPFGSQLHESDYSDVGIPVVMPKDIIDGKISETSTAKISEEIFSQLKRHRLNIGDIIIPRRGNFDKRAIITERENGWFCGTGCLKIAVNQNILAPGYFYYYLSQKDVVDYIESQAIGSTLLNLSGSIVGNFTIPLPPLPIQCRIAEVLGRYDALIENYQKQISKLEGMAQELYREWFVRGRCPYAEPGEDGGLPVGWRIGKLREVVSYYIGGGWGNDEPDSDFPIGGFVIRGTEIPNLKTGQINPEVYRYHKTSNIDSRKLISGDIVFEVSGGSTDQPLGRNALITDEILRQYGDTVICASFCKQVRPDQSIISAYYLQQFFDRLLETQEMGQFEVQSTGISNFRFEDFLDYQSIIIPSKRVLDHYDRVVFCIHKKIGILNLQLTNLRQTRDALLPRLLSGQVVVQEMAEINY